MRKIIIYYALLLVQSPSPQAKNKSVIVIQVKCISHSTYNPNMTFGIIKEDQNLWSIYPWPNWNYDFLLYTSCVAFLCLHFLFVHLLSNIQDQIIRDGFIYVLPYMSKDQP